MEGSFGWTGNSSGIHRQYLTKNSVEDEYGNFRARDIETLSTGHSRGHCIDLYLEQNYGGHTAWVSYTLSKTEESFEHFPKNLLYNKLKRVTTDQTSNINLYQQSFPSFLPCI